MMNTMYTTGPNLIALWGIHALSVVLFFAGAILLVLWAAKSLNQSQLKTWGITLAVIGIIACLLTIGARGAPWVGQSMMQMQQMEKMMGGMMKNDENSGHMNMHGDPMDMSMNDMAAMLERKTGDAFDRAFIEGMIPHHQGAIDMANAARKSAKHEEIRRMADAIISAQQREIDEMNQWMKDWGYAN